MWLIERDWNQILYEREKKEGLGKSAAAMLEFQEALNNCGLRDFGFTSYKFTWRERKSYGSEI